MDFFKFILLMTILLCITSHVENSKIKQCSLKGLDFQQCLNQDQSEADSFEGCCKMLTEIVQAGYSCLCALLRSSSPVIGITVSLKLSNCYISMPSLAHCHEPLPAPPAVELTPLPPATPQIVQMPPEFPKNQPQPSAPNDFLRPLSPKMDDIPLNPPSVKNSTISAGQQPLSSHTLPESGIPENQEKICSGGETRNSILHPALFLASCCALCYYVIFHI